MKIAFFHRLLIILMILYTYAIFPEYHLTFTEKPQGLYNLLTDAFLSGQLYLKVQPSSALLNLPNPYDPVANYFLRLHDASLYQGKYYIYFGILPVVSFYLPIKWLTGLYASNALAVFFFTTIGFLVGFLLLTKIRSRYFPKLSEFQLNLAVLLFGFANGTSILFSNTRIYEVASSSAFCAVMIAVYCLYELLDPISNSWDRGRKRVLLIALFSLFFSLSVAGRPHFAIMCVVLFSALSIYLIYHAPKNQWLTLVSAILLPAIVVAFVLAGYNYLRFGSILDSGHIWQLSCNNIKDLHNELRDISKIPRNLWYSFYFYFLQPFIVTFQFPYIRLDLHNFDYTYHLDTDYYLEGVAGAFTTTPFIVLVFALPKLIKKYFKSEKAPLAWFILFLSFVPLINIFFLLLLPFAIQRYEVDFLPYLVFLSIISFWMLEKNYPLIKILFVITAMFSLAIGLSFNLVFWTFS